jgi:signal transduction histidine kinase
MGLSPFRWRKTRRDFVLFIPSDSGQKTARMPARTFIQKPTIKWSMVFLFWTLLGLSFAGQLYLFSLKTGRPVSWGEAVGSSLSDWYVWAVLSLPIIELARRFRFDSPQWGRSLAIHLVASCVFSLLYMVLRAALGWIQNRWGGVPVTFSETFNLLVIKAFRFNLLIYWVIVSVGHALAYYRQYQERALRATELEMRLAEARLQALQMQLNPHFLFNTLNAIASLMHKDVNGADRMITRLADLLRYALDSTQAQEVTLRQELAFLERYLEIEKTRFGPRLTVRLEIGPETLDALVPNLILQPLVENAIRHGVERRARPGCIELRSRRDNSTLHLEVRDNGPGLPPDRPRREGIGLSNTRARLQHLYGDNHQLALNNVPEGGLIVAVSLPFRTPSEPAPDPPAGPARPGLPTPAIGA